MDAESADGYDMATDRILHFNPENDLALAANTACYTPPKAAVALRASGALMPLWMADENDYVLMAPELIASANRLRERFGLTATPVARLDEVDARFAPWGWSRSEVRTYLSSGFNPLYAPTDKELDNVRQLSHRRSSIALNRHLSADPDGASNPRESFTESDALQILGENETSGGSIVKSPWSSSGRGVIDSKFSSAQAVRRFVSATISRQGSVMIERRLNKTADFAILFNVRHTEVTPLGFSLFITVNGFSYSGNIIAPQAYIQDYLHRLIPKIDFMALQTSACKALEDLLTRSNSHYTGPAGIDMMIYTSENGLPAIAPAIELNLRATMGVIALSVATRIAVNDTNPMLMSVGPRKIQHPDDDCIEIGGLADTPFSFTLKNYME